MASCRSYGEHDSPRTPDTPSSAGMVSDFGGPEPKRIDVKIVFLQQFSGTDLGEPLVLQLKGEEEEISLGNLLAKGQQRVPDCTDVIFQTRAEGKTISCKEALYHKLRTYLEHGDNELPTCDTGCSELSLIHI